MSSVRYEYFEDFSIGDRISLGERTVSKEEIVEFAQRFDPQPFHLDENAGNESVLGGLSASGWHTASIFMRLFVDGILQQAKGNGSPGIDYLNWLRPVYPSDSLSATLEVLDSRESKSNPKLGLVKFSGKVSNQNGNPVMEMEFPMMFAKRGL